NSVKRLGGERLPESQARGFWNSLRDHTHPFFQARPLWRVALPPQAPALDAGPTLIEWNGGQRWVSSMEQSAVDFRAAVARLCGHATLFRFDSKPAQVPVFHPLSPGVKSINLRLKQELDPVGIF